jgi:hypothetical protein
MTVRALLLGCLVAACGGTHAPLPPYFTAVQAGHPSYPEARFITGVGLSSLSAADAETRARENVVLRISTRLESETSSFQRFTTQAGTTETVTSRVSVRSSFDRADLIRVVERAVEDGVYYAYAVLDRAAADRELASAMSADLTSFQAAAAGARKAREAQDAGAFATAAADASRIRQGIDSAFIVRRAITGHPAREEPDYVALRNQLLALLGEARARRVIGVVVKGGGAAMLSELAVNAVKRLGLRPDTGTCAARDRKELTDSTELDVAPEEKCTEGSLGERCEVVVRLLAQACSGGASGAGTMATVRGIHPSDREKARRLAWEKVTPQALETAVRDALKGTVLLEE